MACVNVNISVDYTPGGTGLQSLEFGYRIQGSGNPYTLVPLAGTGGVPATTMITVPCNLDCDAIVYEGYISADCSGEEIPWTAIVVDETATDCYEYEWTCDNVGILTVTFAGGTGYQSGDVIALSGGGGTGALITLDGVLPGGVPSTVIISNPGVGFTSVPTANIISATGSGATATAFLANCPDITHLYCAGDPGAQIMQLELGESYIECASQASTAAKVATIGDDMLYFEYAPTGINCSCADCKEVTITNLNPTKNLTILYQTCEDATVPAVGGALLTEVIGPGATWTSGCEVICSTVTSHDADGFTLDACDAC